MPVIYVLARSLAFMAVAIAWIFFVGTTYFEAMRGNRHRVAGEWSALNYVFYLFYTAPLLIPVAFFWGWWIRMGRYSQKIKLALTALILFVHGGAYMAFLRNAYSPQ